MLKINMLEPRGSWLLVEKWRGVYTIFLRQRGQMFLTAVTLHLWGLTGTKTSFYAAKKVKRVVYYQEN